MPSSTTHTPYRILIGDDHRIVREGLKQVLADAADLHVVAEAASGPEVLETVQALGGTAGLSAVLLDIDFGARQALAVDPALC